MGVLRRMFGFDRAARRTFSDSTPRPVDQMVAEMLHGTGRISRTEALSVPAFKRGRDLICSIATLPLQTIDAQFNVQDHPLMRQIDPNVPNIVTLAQTVEDLICDGVAWWRITQFGDDGFPAHAVRLDPSQVTVNPPTNYRQGYLPDGEPVTGTVYVYGQPVSILSIIRFVSPNPPMLQVGARVLQRACALDRAAEMYAESPRPMDYFTPTDGADPVDDVEVEGLLNTWKVARRKRSTAYVPAALTYNEVQQPTPADLQLVELQKRAALDVANLLGLDPEDIGISTTSRTYQNAVDRRKDRVNDVLSPYMRALTDRLSMGDVTRTGYTVRLVLDDYLKADALTRVKVQQAYQAMGVIDVQDIRQDEGIAPRAGRPDGPIQSTITTNDGAARTPQIAASAPRQLGFARETGLTFDGDPDATFAVDEQARTITGLAVPYGQVARSGGRKWRFAKGSIRYGAVNRVKLLRDHDNAQAVGVAVKFDDTDTGLVATFRIARGDAGDRVLALAADGVLDGLSIGVDFETSDVRPDPIHTGASLVVQAALREVSLTAMPAFDDSRLTSVRASAGKEPGMPEETQATPPAEQPVTFSNDQFAQLLNKLTPTVAEAKNTQQRAVVDPTASAGATFVNEPAPYRFDRNGNIQKGSHDFSADVIAALRDRDIAAHDRAMDTIRAQFDVVGSNVDELNPTRQRPDLYVDQRAFRYPVWDAINKGTLPDVTPFAFPKFNSASGLVGAHTEGNEPSSGSFVTTGQTVTPTAISGKAKISRETWDQGGNPQISNLIWRQMLKGWYEALEAAAVAVLDAATPTAIDMSATPGLADDDLDQAITSAFASLQFVRGGFSMDNLFAQIDLYKALIAATDSSGRRLYPALGPQNALGTVSGRFASLDINGVTAYPAWALAATGTVAASSYLFDSDSVHGWASAPQRLDFNIEVANVYIGLWGYKATAISDINGVRELIYDPS